jgi:hypothetical protein
MQDGKDIGGLACGKVAPAIRHREPSQTINYFQTQQNCNQILDEMLKKSKCKALSQGIEYI